MTDSELYHYGIKGMKWGLRRYQNKDGSLTAAGRKRISKEYKKLADAATNDITRVQNSIYVNAYNKAADYMNSGGIDKFNAKQKKRYGENYEKRNGYEEDYMDLFNQRLADNYNMALNDFYKNNKNYQKSKALVDKYSITDWDDFAKSFEDVVSELNTAAQEAQRRHKKD